jgi:N utilization substance protein B
MARKAASTSLKRLAARLAAVQGLYDMELAGHTAQDVIAAFTARGGTASLEGEEVGADPQLFADIVRGVASEGADLDAIVAGAGRARSDISRYEALLRQILRAGTFELRRHPQYDAALLISQYLTVTDSFYDRTEIGLVNAVLDSLAKNLRPDGDRQEPGEPEGDPLETPIADSSADGSSSG